MSPVLPAFAGDLQSGSVLGGGGVEGPAFVVRRHLQRGRALNVPIAVVFADVQAAFYSILPEVILGKALALPARQAA